MLFQHDVFVFQKNYSRYHCWLMKGAKLIGKEAYMDLDDAPSRVISMVTLRNVETMMGMSDDVFVGSQMLKKHCSKFQKNTILLPSSINLINYKVRTYPLREKVCLGWIGNGKHYCEDLINILVEPLRVLAQCYALKLRIDGVMAGRC